MKTLPALPSMSARDVLRIGAVTTGRAPAPANVIGIPITAARPGEVLRVVHPTLGISCPCASPAVAARLNEFFSR